MKISSSVVLLVCFAASTVAVDVASDRPGHATTTTLRGQRRLKKNTRTSGSSDQAGAGRNVNNSKNGQKKKGKKKGEKKGSEVKKEIQAVSEVFSGFASQMKENEGKNVLGTGPLKTTPGLSKEEGSGTPSTWTPPSSIKQKEEERPDDGMPPPQNDIDAPDDGMPDNETDGGGMSDKEMGGGEAGKQETEPETETGAGMETEKESETASMQETETESETTSGGVINTTPQVEEKPEEASPPELETSPPASTGGASSAGNSLVARPVAPVGDCNLNVESLQAKEDPATTTKRCTSSCECAESCCIYWTFGSFCAQPHSSREGRAAFGGGYVRCMPLDPSQ